MINDKVNENNEKYWTALMIACRNSNTYSDNLVVKILIILVQMSILHIMMDGHL